MAQTKAQLIDGLNNSEFDNINVTGISTLGTVKVSSGIVTASAGIVTYYGDGSNLTGISKVSGNVLSYFYAGW